MTTGVSDDAPDSGADSPPAGTTGDAVPDTAVRGPGEPEQRPAGDGRIAGPRAWPWGPPPVELFGTPDTAFVPAPRGADGAPPAAVWAAAAGRQPYQGHGYPVPAPPSAPAHVTAMSGGAWGAGVPAAPPATWWSAPPGWGPAGPGAWAAPGPYWGPYPVPARDNGTATAALVCGLLSVLLCFTAILGVLLGVPAVICGCVGRSRARKGPVSQRRTATAGAVLGGIGLLLSIAAFALVMIFAGDSPSTPADPGHGVGPRTYHVALQPMGTAVAGRR